MSLYRLAVRSGILIREKRKLLRWWCWSFNRSEEDYLTRMKNRLVKLRAEQAELMKMIPEHEKRLKDAKDTLLNRDGGTGPPHRAPWSPTHEPVVLRLDVKLKGKPKPSPAKRRDGVIAELTVPK